MAERVNVTIFGQKYDILGDKDAQDIIKVAEYVNNKMHLISKMTEKNGTGTVATLTALNIADENFDALGLIERLKQEKEKVERENEQFSQKLEDSNRSLKESRESIENMRQDQQGDASRFSELEQKCKEYENTIFDQQMEIIQLKSSLEKYERE